VKRQCPNH